jgi:DNA-binding GntR family transcriptional regulator
VVHLAAVPSYRTKTDIVLETLRARIISGELVPGARLILREIGEEFACSDIPVREAMRALASEGLVAIVPHGGARVTELQADELMELTETRSLLEPRATVLAGMAMPDAAVDALEQILEAMQAVAAGTSGEDYSRLNREFHRTILAHCPNRRLAALIEDLWGKAERGRLVHRIFRGHVDASLAQHAEIVSAIRARDAGRLAAIAELHSAHGFAAVRRLAEDDRLSGKTPTRG